MPQSLRRWHYTATKRHLVHVHNVLSEAIMRGQKQLNASATNTCASIHHRAVATAEQVKCLVLTLTLEASDAVGTRCASKSGRVQASSDQGVLRQLLALRQLVH